MKTSSSRNLLAVGLAVSALVLAGCSAPAPEPSTTADPADAAWAEVEAKAAEEGQLTVYLATQDAVNTALVAAFNEQYPDIQVNWIRLESGAQTARVASEIESGAPTADIMQVADNLLLEQHPEWFRDITDLPNYANIPKERQVSGYYAFTQAAPFVVTYNTDKIDPADVPTTWKELANSDEVKDGLMINPKAANSFMAADAFIDEEAGDDVLKKLGDNVRGFADASAPAVQQVVAGEASLVFPNVREQTTVARQQGAPVETIVPTPSIGVVNLWSMPKDTLSPNAAAVFVNFALSKAGVTATCNKGDYQPFGYSDIPDCPQSSSDLKLVLDIYPTLTDARKAEILSKLGLQ